MAAVAQLCAKVVEVNPVTTDRYRRTVAVVRVGETVVNEELIRQGLARVFTRYCDRALCEQRERLEDEAEIVVNGGCYTNVGVSDK